MAESIPVTSVILLILGFVYAGAGAFNLFYFFAKETSKEFKTALACLIVAVILITASIIVY